MVCSTLEQMKAAWWIPRPLVALPGVMYCACNRARSASIAAMSILVSLMVTPLQALYRNLLQDPELHADVAPGRAGVRADLVGFLGELADLLALHPGYVDDERDDQAERVALRPDSNLRRHRRVAECRVLPARDEPQRAVKARGIAGREQLLRVRPSTRATHLRREGQVKVELAIGRDHVAVAAITAGH